MELECTMDGQDVIVIDSGTRYLKVGLSGEDCPRAILANCRSKDGREESKEEEHDQQAAARKSTSYCDAALSQDPSTIVWPVERGVCEGKDNREVMEDIWGHALRSVLEIEQVEECTVLLADCPHNTMLNREWMAEVFFETFKVRALGIFNSAVLSLFSTGLTRGLVLESGEGLTRAVPVFEGYAINHAIFKMETAGQDITERVLELSRKHGICDPTIRTAQAMKEKVCSVALNYDEALATAETGDIENRSFELPDGTIVQVPKEVRMGAPEILFSGEADKTATSICKQAIETVDFDFQQDLVRALVVTGGTSMLPGLQQRVAHELSGVLNTDLARQLEVVADSQRKHATWIGGSMLASLSTFSQLAMTRQEFEDSKTDNRKLVPRKTF
jgi:actin-related protein